MKLAWIENDRIRDIAPGNPSELYCGDVAQHYNTEVPDNAENGDGWVNGQLVKPVPPPPAPPAPPPAPVSPTVGPIAFKLLFTAQERIAVKTSTDPVIQDFWQIVEDPRTSEVNLALKATQDALGYLVTAGLLTEARKVEILTGQLI